MEATWLSLALAAAAAAPISARQIQDRIDAAAPGSTLRLPKGRIRGTLRVDKPLTVRGAGPRRTLFISDGRKPALMVSAPEGTTVQIEKVGFTTARNAADHRGAGVMIHGPGQVILRRVHLRKTIRGRCLSSALTLNGPIDLRLEQVQIEKHHCFVAGALIVEPGMKVTLVDSLLEANVGELAGAILFTGGQLRVESTVFRNNRFARADDGHDLVLGGSEGQIELIASDFSSDPHRSVAFEGDADVHVAVTRMRWLDDDRPDSVTLLDR